MLQFVRELHRLLTPRQLRQYVLMQLLFVVTAVLQVGGIASIAPFVALVTNPALIHSNVVARYVFDSYSFGQ